MTRLRSLIGIAGEESLVPKPWGEQRRASAPMTVVEGMAAAGGAPVLLPPSAGVDHLARVDAGSSPEGSTSGSTLSGTGTRWPWWDWRAT